MSEHLPFETEPRSSPTPMPRPWFKVLGVRVDDIQIPEVIAQMEEWIRQCARCHYIAVTGMHGITVAQEDPVFRQILGSADLVVPDGMPLVWLGRYKGFALRRRVYGPELMETFCRETGPKYRHFFYGGASGVPERVARVLHERHGLMVAGAYSPPFRALTQEEDEELMERTHAAAPDVLWVGLSTPKQEQWMCAHRYRLRVPVMVGVGAAFDFLAGRVKQAPVWMREHGFEWLYRLGREPGRLWRRYLLSGSKFVGYVSLELSGLRDFGERSKEVEANGVEK